MKEEKNNNLQQFLRAPMAVYMLALIVVAVVGLLLIGAFKSYRSEMTMMLIARSDYSVADKREIAGNLAELPKLLSFYDLLLKDNPDITDRNAGMGTAKRKAAWKNILRVENVNNGGSSLIYLDVTMPDSDDAEVIAKKSANTLVAVTGRYYDISKDIDLRIVDGPVTKPVVNDWFIIILLSVASGVGVVLVYFSFPKAVLPKFPFDKKSYNFTALHGIRDIFAKKESGIVDESEGKKEIESIYAAEESLGADMLDAYAQKDKAASQVPSNLPVGPDSSIFSDQYPNFPEMPTVQAKTASAPANLPFADDELFASRTGATRLASTSDSESRRAKAGHPNQHSKSETKEIPGSEIEKETEAAPDREPSMEEMKKRLNQLLRGEL